MNKEVLLSVHNLCKDYPGVHALSDVSFDVYKGEIHALIGENGAGKSTLIKALAGAISPTSGEFVYNGQAFSRIEPALAKELGISVIYQEFNLMNSLTVAENVFMGHYPIKHGLIDKKQMKEKTTEIFKSMGVEMDPDAIVMDLSTAYMQLVEIAKSLSRELKLLIMDEPTAPLTTKEVELLFDIIKKLKESGVTIIFISHRLNEIFDICDRVTILRDGKFVLTDDVKNMDKAKLIKGMIGREISNAYPDKDIEIKEEVLRLENLSGNGVENINFTLHKGEILGLAGLVGAGRTEIMRVLFGADRKNSGKVFLNGKEINNKSPEQAIKNKIVLLPEDRKQQGLLLMLTIAQNISLPNLSSLTKKLVVDRKAEKEMVNKQKENLQIACYSTDQITNTLSGGNQQKVVIGKWLAGDADVYIFDEPTRGIDVGAKYEIYTLMNSLCKEGKAIIMISSDMEEMLGMSDRIVVMCEGEQMAILNKDEFNQETILRYASGERKQI